MDEETRFRNRALFLLSAVPAFHSCCNIIPQVSVAISVCGDRLQRKTMPLAFFQKQI